LLLRRGNHDISSPTLASRRPAIERFSVHRESKLEQALAHSGRAAVMSGITNTRWQRHLVIHDGWRVFVRPTSRKDESLIRDLLGHVSKEDVRLRFFDSVKEFSHQFIAKLTDLDGLRAIAFIAFDEASSETLGVVWLYCDPVHETGEYAILLRSDLKGRGLGWTLMQLIIEYAKSENLKQMCGQILQENAVMLKMCRELGFKVVTDAQDRGVCDVTLTL
jgi:GNAT superfamily N-acetyltransferase